MFRIIKRLQTWPCVEVKKQGGLHIVVRVSRNLHVRNFKPITLNYDLNSCLYSAPFALLNFEFHIGFNSLADTFCDL
jgi:hypothetical protein